MKKIISITIFWVVAFANITHSNAQNTTSVFDETLRDTIIFAQTNRWRMGADLWLDRIPQMEKDEDIPQNDIAFGLVICSIFLERSDDANAYETWSTSLKLFLNGGSTWEQYRSQLKVQIENLNYQISSSFSSEGAASAQVSKNALILHSIDKLISYTSYEGPRPGLKKPKQDDRVLTVARSYFPQANVSPDADTSAPSRSRNQIDSTENDADNSSNFGRAVIPLPSTNDAPSEEKPDPDDVIVAINEDTKNDPEKEAELSLSDVLIDEQDIDADLLDVPAPIAAPTLAVAEEPLEGLQPLDPLNASLEKELAGGPIAPRIAHINVRRALPLTNDEKEIARRAWRYFIENRQSNTGFVNSVHSYPYTTMWDLGSSIAALHCAYYLDLVDDLTFRELMTTFLSTLRDMPLYDDQLPNREYDTRSGLMTNLRNAVDDKGSGYSSLDIARTLIWLYVIRKEHPEYSDQINSIVENWRLSRAVHNAELYRELLISQGVDRKQEGRFGYEQYAALGFSLWNINLPNALDTDNTVEIEVEGIPLLKDQRKPDFLNLEPFLLTKLEFSKSPDAITEQLDALIEIHQRRTLDIGSPQLFTEDSIDKEPWFLYNVVTSEDGDWQCKMSNQKPHDYCQVLSTKAAFAAAALYNLDFLNEAKKLVTNLFHSRFGYYSGIYEEGETNKALTVNSNAIILESLAFKKRGAAFVDIEFDARKFQSRSRLAN